MNLSIEMVHITSCNSNKKKREKGSNITLRKYVYTKREQNQNTTKSCLNFFFFFLNQTKQANGERRQENKHNCKVNTYDKFHK